MTGIALTALTLIAFASNSLLCRMALRGDLIDPLSFTALRLVSGAGVLLFASQVIPQPAASNDSKGSWVSGIALFTYAVSFSLAYLSLATGMGALILFGSVQVTMMAAALNSGENLSPIQWLGAVAAVGGLVYLVLPGLSAPDPLGAVLMGASGAAWGVYSIRGKGVSSPVAMTAGNFLRSSPLAVITSLMALRSAHLQPSGVLLALISGGLTSGVGYVLWYKALGKLTTTQASLVQLLVPVLAAFGGVVFLSEHVSTRLITSSALMLGGIALAVSKRHAIAAWNRRG
ncbi:MAG: DMT family transporter [Acidobacteriota bacterium]